MIHRNRVRTARAVIVLFLIFFYCLHPLTECFNTCLFPLDKKKKKKEGYNLNFDK